MAGAAAVERTLVIVKPDGVQRGLVGEILRRFEGKGLQIAALKLARLPKATLEKHYSEHAAKPFYAGLLAFMSSSPVVVVAVRGLNAITVVRGLMGKTFGKDAAPGKLRRSRSREAWP